MVGANCRRYVTADAMGMAKVGGKHEEEECRWGRNRVGHKHAEGHHDVPGVGPLRRDNTPTSACLFYINALSYNNSFSIYSGEGERRRGLGSLLLPPTRSVDSRLGFVNPYNGNILMANSLRLHP